MRAIGDIAAFVTSKNDIVFPDGETCHRFTAREPRSRGVVAVTVEDPLELFPIEIVEAP